MYFFLGRSIAGSLRAHDLDATKNRPANLQAGTGQPAGLNSAHLILMTGLRATIVCLFVGLLSSTAAPLDFARDIRPLLSDACYNCHGPDAKARKAGLRLDDRAAAHDSGVLTNGEMLRRLTTTEPDERMPPLESNRTLTDEQRAKLAQWLRAGAAWPSDDRHWAFVPPKRPPLAKVNDSAWQERHRPLHPGQTGKRATRAFVGSRQGHAAAPGFVRSYRPAADGRGSRRLPCRHVVGRLRTGDRSPT